MPPIETIFTVALAGFALAATPGPSMLYVLSRSVGQSRGAGLASAIGLCLGGVLLAVATALGLAAIFEQFSWLVVILKYVGSAYLIWLGISMIRDAYDLESSDFAINSMSQQPIKDIVKQGVLVELLNPKTVLFFALFLPPFVHVADGQIAQTSVQLQLLVLGVLVPLTAIPSDLVIAFMGGTLAQTFQRKQKLRRVLAWIGGAILILIAINLHLELL